MKMFETKFVKKFFRINEVQMFTSIFNLSNFAVSTFALMSFCSNSKPILSSEAHKQQQTASFFIGRERKRHASKQGSLVRNFTVQIQLQRRFLAFLNFKNWSHVLLQLQFLILLVELDRVQTQACWPELNFCLLKIRAVPRTTRA